METKRQNQLGMQTAIPAMAGFIAPVAFTVTVIVQGLLQPDYSHVQLPISALAAWPWGWVQNLNFFVFGLLMIAFAAGLHRGVRPHRRGAEDSPLHPWVGLLQRLILAVWFPCIIVLALRLWRLAHTSEQAANDGEAASTVTAAPPWSA